MFLLVSRVPKGLEELRGRFENHVHSQGLAAIEKCGETAMSVSFNFSTSKLQYNIICSTHHVNVRRALHLKNYTGHYLNDQ